MHRTVLVAAAAGEAGHDALALGIALARPFGAEVILAGVASGHGLRHPSPQALLPELERLRDAAPTDLPVSVRTSTARSLPHDLQDLALELGAQLLVLGPVHRGAVPIAPCAVAVAVRGQSMHGPGRVGVAWNDTPEANEALEWGVQLAERTAAVVRIVRVLDPREAEDGKLTFEVEERLRSLRRAAGARATTETDVLWGEPADALTDATRGLDLLVLGSRAHGPLRRALLGSVSTKVVHRAQCAVVVLPRGVFAPPDTAAV
jgi:nucleotide-binding universal stress UspA family protein